MCIRSVLKIAESYLIVYSHVCWDDVEADVSMCFVLSVFPIFLNYCSYMLIFLYFG